MRDADKFARLIAFARSLPALRATIDTHMGTRGMGRDKVLATVVHLLDRTLIRVGNREYAVANKSFGLTTLRDRHVAIAGATVRFRFRGKSGIDHAIALNDRRLARVVRQCRDLPGYHLFQYLDADGQRREVDSSDVNDYLRAIGGEDFTAKDFRTWAGTVGCLLALGECDGATPGSEAKQRLVAAIKATAQRLGNTPAVCRRSYIHPAVIAAYLAGELGPSPTDTPAPEGLNPAERRILALLERSAQAA